MAHSSSSQPMRGRIVSGSDGSCGCCNSWGPTRASDKRQWEAEAKQEIADLQTNPEKQSYTSR